MKIAIDIRRAGDFGIGTYIRNIVNQFARLDQSTHYLLIGQQKHLDELDPLPANFELLDCGAERGSLRCHFRMPLMLRKRRVDLLHLPWFQPLTVIPCPMVVTVHDLTTILIAREHRGLRHAMRIHLARRLFSRARRILTVSYSSKRELARTFDVPEARIEVIYNAVDERFTRDPLPADADRILERHAVNSPFVLYAGNIKPQKNLPRLIEAFAVAKAELRDHPQLAQLKLLVIGDELTKHPDLRRAVVRTRVREDVRFLGFVPLPVLRVFYARARAFLFPSLYEGFGLPPLEAMAHGTPVLTSNVSSLPEVFDDAALLVNPENVFDIARGIRQILTDEDLRTQLIARGHAQVRKYSWQQTAEKVRAVYQSVLNGKL
ncbi:MAG: glycosyltransferase family 4 protein [Acidobacteria bacterium]|nr:glycosyltransferase family 4 protein [Acidobacteriota bacterium]MBI3662426.1 glycosyltransferase family 4 protein [Acidobacteriota bacterium]